MTNVSVHATVREGGKITDCVVKCGDREVEISFRPDDIVVKQGPRVIAGLRQPS